MTEVFLEEETNDKTFLNMEKHNSSLSTMVKFSKIVASFWYKQRSPPAGGGAEVVIAVCSLLWLAGGAVHRGK